MRFFLHSLLSVLFCVVLISSENATADVIKLKNGGELRGRIDRKKSSAKSTTIQIITITGANVVVARKDIQFVTRRPQIIEKYETRAKKTPDNISAQWEMVEWCRDNKLKKQSLVHLENIVKLEPDNKKARTGLNQSLRNGKWMTRDTWMTSQGYVKYKNRYITSQELELINQNKAERKKEKAWVSKVRVWFRWMRSSNAQRQKKGYDNLVSLTDPHAIPALKKLMGKHKQDSVRQFFIRLLTKMEGSQPVRPLVKMALYDINHELRYAALNGISEDQYTIASPRFLRTLKSKHNTLVRRAGVGLEHVGNDQAIPYLIEALITTHQYKMRVPKKGITMRSGGNATPIPPQIEGLLRTGQLPNGVIINNQDMIPNDMRPMVTVTVDYRHHNDEVLSALKKITGQSFGYDKRTWRLWWTTKKNGVTQQ